MLDRESLKDLLVKAADADQAPVALGDLEAEVGGMIEALDSANATIAENEKTIAELRDTNMKLFLRSTGTVEEKDPEKTTDEVLEDYFEELFKED